MIIDLQGKKRELVRDALTGARLFQFDDNGRVRLNTMMFTPVMIQKILARYTHVIVEATEDEKKAFGLLPSVAPKLNKVEEKKEENQIEEVETSGSDGLDDLSEDELRELGKEHKIRSFHNMKPELLIQKIREKKDGIT